MIESMYCPLCSTQLQEQVDTFFFVCSLCGAYVKDRQFLLSDSEEKARYELHQNTQHDEGYLAFIMPIIRFVLEHFSPVDAGLDYGSGPQPALTEVLRDKGYNVTAFDPYFAPQTEYTQTSYSYIICCEVLEHFAEPRQELEHLLKLLRPGGAIILKTHLWDGQGDFATWYYRRDPTHIFICTPRTIEFIGQHFHLATEYIDDRTIHFSSLPATTQ